MIAGSENSRNYGGGKGNKKKKGMDRHYDRYGVGGHVKDTCFKLHGYPQ